MNSIKTKLLLILLPFLLLNCTEQNKTSQIPSSENNSRIVFPEHTKFCKHVINSIPGKVKMSKRKEYIVYYSGESYTEQNLEYLLSIADSAVQRVKDVLNIDDYSKGFYLIMLDSRDEMEQAIGERYKGLASGNNNLGIFVFNQEIRPYFKHELFHLFAFNVWGEPASRLLDEGGAMYSDNECLYYKDPISTINKYLYAQGKWFDLDILINNFNSAASENDLIAYLESAFIFRFLFEKFGMEKIKKLWVGGFQQFEEIYGFSIPQLNSYISKEMKNIENQEVNWEELMNKGCG